MEHRNSKLKRIFVNILPTFLVFIYTCVYLVKGDVRSDFVLVQDESSFKHDDEVDKFYEKRETWETSNLGTLLFKKSVATSVFSDHRKNKTFVVLIWEHYELLKDRHIRGYNKSRSDPLNTCSVKNCIFTGKESMLNTADAVLIDIHYGVIPKVKSRNVSQRWIFLSDESPRDTFSAAKGKPRLVEFANFFNWSMTYRSDSDVPVPYGRTLPLPLRIPKQVPITELVPFWWDKQTDVVATILISNCKASYRMDFLKMLKKHLKIDVYGKCSDKNKQTCPGHIKSDCSIISKYLFYLAFESSNCDEYLSEKAFYHAYEKGAIPVILGPSIENCVSTLPPNSFLHVDNFTTFRDLATKMLQISQNINKIWYYHKWRRDFQVVNEHGYFGTDSFHYCRLCEALNYNDEEKKTYDLEALKFLLEYNLNCQVNKKLPFSEFESL